MAYEFRIECRAMKRNSCNSCGYPVRGVCLLVGLALVCFAGVGCSPGEVEPVDPVEPDTEAPDTALAEALTFHASFDTGADADFGAGDRSIYSAPAYDERDEPTPGLEVPDVEIVPGAGRFGNALRFNKTNKQALFYKAQDNVAYSTTDMAGTVSFWLSVDPAVDIEPVYCDPIQITDVNYNDAAVWVDFTNQNPKQFRMGVFGDLAVWNPEGLPAGENPDFENRLVAVNELPFGSGQWTHVVITYSGLNSPDGGIAKLYLNGQLQGSREGIVESFTWDVERAVIKLGLNYVGLYDDIAVFRRALNDEEVAALHQLETGAAALHE